MMNAQTVINRLRGWEERINHFRQILIDLERDLESFRNCCKQEKLAEFDAITQEHKAIVAKVRKGG